MSRRLRSTAARPRHRAGMLLLDMIVALAILSIGLATILTTIAGMGQRQVSNESIINASMVAQAEMERALNKGFTNVDTLEGTGLTYDATYYPGYTYDLVVDYVAVTDLNTVSGSATKYKRVVVTVYHTLKGAVIKRSEMRTIMIQGT